MDRSRNETSTSTSRTSYSKTLHHSEQGLDFLAGPPVDSPFSNINVRRRFVQKVYTLLAIQLFYTVVFTAFFLLYPPIRNYFAENPSVMLILLIAGLVVYNISSCVLSCCSTTAGRIFPLNYILLFLTTTGLSLCVALICLQYELSSVLLALVIAAITCLLVSLLSCCTSFDITKCSWLIFIASFAFIFTWLGYGILVAIFPKIHIPIMQLVFSSIGLFISILLLAFWTQMVIGGRRYEISPEDHILATLLLYQEIISIFLYLLQVISELRNNN